MSSTASALRKRPDERSDEDVSAVESLLASLTQNLDAPSIKAVATKLEFRAVEKGSVVWQDISSALAAGWVLLLAGSLGLQETGIQKKGDGQPKKEVTISPGATVWELTQAKTEGKTFAIVALEESELGVLSRETFDQVLKGREAEARRERREFIASLDACRTLGSDDVKRLAAAARPVHRRRGEVIVKQGAVPAAVYAVRSGEVKLVRRMRLDIGDALESINTDDFPFFSEAVAGPTANHLARSFDFPLPYDVRDLDVSVVAAGQVIEESASIEGRPASATAIAATEVTLLAIPPADLARRLGPEGLDALKKAEELRRSWREQQLARVEAVVETVEMQRPAIRSLRREEEQLRLYGPHFARLRNLRDVQALLGSAVAGRVLMPEPPPRSDRSLALAPEPPPPAAAPGSPTLPGEVVARAGFKSRAESGREDALYRVDAFVQLARRKQEMNRARKPEPRAKTKLILYEEEDPRPPSQRGIVRKGRDGQPLVPQLPPAPASPSAPPRQASIVRPGSAAAGAAAPALASPSSPARGRSASPQEGAAPRFARSRRKGRASDHGRPWLQDEQRSKALDVAGSAAQAMRGHISDKARAIFSIIDSGTRAG